MLKVDDNLRFFFLPTFTDMRCKHSRVIAIIREQLMREPEEGDAYIIMSRDRHTVRVFGFEKTAVSLYEKKFKKGYKFLKVEKKGAETLYRIHRENVVRILECPAINSLKIK